LTLELGLVLALLCSVIVMFVMNMPRMDAAALIMIVALPFTGVITMNEALSGFADPTIILIAALFVIGEGLVRTGVARRLGDWMYAKAGDSEVKLLVLLMAATAGLGSIMSSTAVVAIFIPVVLRICQNSGTPPSRLMMPLSFAALISGMLTLVATAPNLVVHGELIRQGFAGFGFFSIAPFGLPILVLAILYMLVARRWLGAGGAADGKTFRRPSVRDWIEQYGLSAHEHRMRLGPRSSLIDCRIEDLGFRARGINILAIERERRFGIDMLRPSAELRLQPGDVMLVDVVAEGLDLEALRGEFGLEALPLDPGIGFFTDRAHALGMVEVIVPAESWLVGQTLREAKLRDETALIAIGLRRGRAVVEGDLLVQTLAAGDTLLLVGFWDDIRRIQSVRNDLVVLNLPADLDDVAPAATRAPHALGTLALVVGLMVSGVVPNVQAALIGCLLMGLFGCVDMTSAYRAISWKSLVLIVGMLPFSLALQRTGGVDLASDGLIALVGEAGPHLVLGTLFALTAALGLFISNTATAVLMAPVAISLAQELGASPYPFAMIVALAASTAFMTPISSPVNTLVVGPGNYSFGDFTRIGVPFSLIVLVVSVILVPIVLPFR
jgi:di/tricarboxylate transporter